MFQKFPKAHDIPLRSKRLLSFKPLFNFYMIITVVIMHSAVY